MGPRVLLLLILYVHFAANILYFYSSRILGAYTCEDYFYFHIDFRHLMAYIRLCSKIIQMSHFGDEAMDQQQYCEQAQTGQILYDVICVTLSGIVCCTVNVTKMSKD